MIVDIQGCGAELKAVATVAPPPPPPWAILFCQIWPADQGWESPALPLKNVVATCFYDVATG